MLDTITIACYFAGATTQGLGLFKKITNSSFWLMMFGIPAILLHSFLLYRWIDLSAGQNLTIFNLLSLASFVTGLVIVLIALKKPIHYLCVFIFPIAAISILLAGYFPSHHIVETAKNPKQFIHILLSVVTFSILVVAALQAITLAIQERFLRQKYFAISQMLPSIEAMENWLFQIIGVGAALLSMVLITSIYFFHLILLQQFLQKTILTLLAWCVFVVLLIGRHYFGWRGKKAIYCTLGGVILLTLTYFSSLLILGLLP